MTKEIQLTQGQVAIVDDEDFERLNQHKWYAWYNPHTHSFCAQRSVRIDGKHGVVLMSRFIMDAPSGMRVDHINHNTLDNSRENLRLTTNAQNMRNQCRHRDGSSRFKGTSWYNGKWRAMITVDGKPHHLGYFILEVDAARAYNDAAHEWFGEYAMLNTLPMS